MSRSSGHTTRSRVRSWAARVVVTALVAGGMIAIAAPAHAVATRTVAYYSMDEPTGATVLRDSSGNGRNGAIGADVTTGVLYQGATGHRFATHMPSAGAFAGHTSRVPHSTSLNPDAGDFSIEIRLRTTYSFGNIMQKGQGTAVGGYWKLENPGGLPRCLFRGADGSSRTGYSNIDITDGQWHTIRCNRTSTYVEMWVDGVRQSRLNGSTGNIANTTDLSIGGKSSCDGLNVTCDYFIGDVDYIRIEKGDAPAANVPPVSAPVLDCLGLVCSASGATSSDPDGAIQRYQWDFGDGALFDGASVPTAFHTYAGAGTYTVKLTVTDDRGATTTAQRQITIAPAAETITFVDQATSNVNASTHQVTVPVSVQPGDTMLLFFSQNSQATITGPTGVTGWTQIDTLSGGSARTTVWSKVAQAGDAGTATRISLSAGSKGNMVLAAYRGVDGVSAAVARTDAASSLTRITPTAQVAAKGSWAVSYWMHGDGVTNAMTPPSGVVVRSNGSQTGGGRVTGLLTDSGAMVPTLPYGGLSAAAAAASTTTTSWTLVLRPDVDGPTNQPPVASFTATCDLLVCFFDGTASSDSDGTVVSYRWEFGDGSTATTATPTTSHTYGAAGAFTAKLTVTDSSGLAASATRSVTVAPENPQPAEISFVDATTTSRTSIAQSTAVPAAVQPGDVMVMFLSLASTAAITDPAGWQPLGTTDGGALRTRAWYKVAAAADAGATVNVSVDGSIKGNLTIAAYRGADSAAPVFLAAAAPGTTAVRTTPTAPVAVVGSWALSYWAHRDSAATTITPSGDVQSRALGVQTGGGRVTTLLADSGAGVAAGTYGGITGTVDAASAHGVAWTVILIPD